MVVLLPVIANGGLLSVLANGGHLPVLANGGLLPLLANGGWDLIQLLKGLMTYFAFPPHYQYIKQFNTNMLLIFDDSDLQITQH
jgi:hypothetical protein